MRTIVLLSLATLAGTAGAAEELARVVSATPVMQTVAVPQQSCSVQPVAVGPGRTGAGAVIGAIAGGALGNAIGNGSGRAAATVLGLIGGAVLGDSIEGGGPVQVQHVQQCTTQTYYENRPVAFNVVYEYGGKQYAVQMPTDPGPTVRLQITPVSMATPQQPMAAQGYEQPPVAQGMVAPVYYAPAPVVAAPVVVAPVYRSYPPIGISLNFGFHGSRYSGGYRHWR